MRSRVELSLAIGIVALGVVLLLGAFRISAGAGYDRIGPRFFPFVVATGFVILGAWYAVSIWRNRWLAPEFSTDSAKANRLNWSAFGHLILAFTLCLALLGSIGFVMACSVQFWLVARAFGSQRPVRDAVAALVVATAVYIAFSRGLGLALPSGWVEKGSFSQWTRFGIYSMASRLR
jgi:putative tricarboxylic transport membrane protein